MKGFFPTLALSMCSTQNAVLEREVVDAVDALMDEVEHNAESKETETDGEETETDGEETETARLRQLLLLRGFTPKTTIRRPLLLPSLDLKGVAAYMRSERCQNIIVMCGAGDLHTPL